MFEHNPLSLILNGNRRKQSRTMDGDQLSQLLRDVDRVCMSGSEAEGDPAILDELAVASPEQAAATIRELLSRSDAATVEQQLGLLGVVCGVLQPNKGVPSGVCGVRRSETPMILMTERVPAKFDRGQSIAHELGVLIYHRAGELGVQEFAEQLRPDFTIVTPEVSSAQPMREITA